MPEFRHAAAIAATGEPCQPACHRSPAPGLPSRPTRHWDWATSHPREGGRLNGFEDDRQAGRLGGGGPASARRARKSGRQHQRAMTNLYCGNNALSPQLAAQGGRQQLGTPTQCFRKGYAAALHQDISDLDAFLATWTGPYRPHVAQRLYYGDSQVAPPGYDSRATLPQALQRGFGMF